MLTIKLRSLPLDAGGAWQLGDGIQEERDGLVDLVHPNTAQDFLQEAQREGVVVSTPCVVTHRHPT